MTLTEEFIKHCTKENFRKFTIQKSDGKIAINSIDIFSHLESKYNSNNSFLEVLNAFCHIASISARGNFNKQPHPGSFNNCNGRWFELIFLKEFCKLIDAHNIEHPKQYAEIYKLPSATKGKKIYDLFVKDERDRLIAINPSTSNPDFILLKNLEKTLYPNDVNSIVDKFSYSGFFGKVNMENVDTIISIKTSARPDRRYQQVYEANLIKALFERFNHKTRFISITLYENAKNEEVYYSTSIISIIKDKKDFKPSIERSIVLSEIEDVRIVYDYIFE